MILLFIIAIIIVATIVLRKRQRQEFKMKECEEKLKERLKIIKISSEQLPAYKEKFLKDCMEGKE